MDKRYHEIAEMAKRFTELYRDYKLGLCGISGTSGPEVQLVSYEFKKNFSEYNIETDAEGWVTLTAYLDGVRFIALER